MVLLTVFVLIYLLLPQYVYSSCCRLPFTDGECQVNRKGPHRYQLMPDRQSGQVLESTECHINDFDSNYRKVVETKNYCNDCPGLLILHTNSSEIFLFPEYLERILEGRTQVQRKNVVIVTSSLVGAYDLDFTFLSRYYAPRPINEVPSIYIDLQLPLFDPKQENQPNLRLRLPSYNEDKEDTLKINREDLLNPLDNNNQDKTANVHQLPYLYHFDIEKHRHSPDLCTLYDVQLSSNSLTWKILDTGLSTCHTFMPYFGRNRCLATGFTRLFCPIEEDISNEDRLQLSPYLKTTNHVEHLTLAVTGGRHVHISFTNDQTRPAEQIKILLLQGYLVVNDINLNLPIRVEYGTNCADFGLVVPAGFSATRYRRFDGENLVFDEGKTVITLPSCFKVIPSSAQILSPINPNPSIAPSVIDETESNDGREINSNVEKPAIFIDLNITNSDVDDDHDDDDDDDEEEEKPASSLSGIFRNKNNIAYAIIILLILVALIPLCLGVFYRVYCRRNRQSDWTLEHGDSGETNPAYVKSKDDHIDKPNPPYVSHSTQTIDAPIRI